MTSTAVGWVACSFCSLRRPRPPNSVRIVSLGGIMATQRAYFSRVFRRVGVATLSGQPEPALLNVSQHVEGSFVVAHFVSVFPHHCSARDDLRSAERGMRQQQCWECTKTHGVLHTCLAMAQAVSTVFPHRIGDAVRLKTAVAAMIFVA